MYCTTEKKGIFECERQLPSQRAFRRMDGAWRNDYGKGSEKAFAQCIEFSRQYKAVYAVYASLCDRSYDKAWVAERS